MRSSSATAVTITFPSGPEMTTERKPLAHLERRDVYRGFRFTETEDKEYQAGAVQERVDFSTYCRECLRMGHSMKQAQRLMKQAGV
jgi:hypothetical protein